MQVFRFRLGLQLADSVYVETQLCDPMSDAWNIQSSESVESDITDSL